MFKEKFLRNILLLSIAIILIFPLYDIFIAYPSFINALKKDSENDAKLTAVYLIRMLNIRNLELNKESPAVEKIVMLIDSDKIEHFKKDLNLMKLKIYLPSGENIYSTDPEDLGKINQNKLFHEIVAKGGTYVKIIKKDTKSLEGQLINVDVVETYVPIMKGDKFLGALEIYYDITVRKERLEKLRSEAITLVVVLAFVLLILVIMVSSKASRTINERNKIEQELKDSEKKYRDLVDTSLVGVYKTNLKGDLLYVNKAIARMFEYTSTEEMMSINVLSLYKNPEDRDVLFEKLKRTGKVDNFEIETLTSTGNPKNILLSATLAGDTLSGMIVDITELKKTQETLQRVEHMAVIGELATGLAYEIRNPLAGIKASVEILSEEQNFPEEDKSIILKSINEIKRIESLLQSLLNFAKPSKPQLTDVDFHKIIDNTLTFSLKHPSLLSNKAVSINVIKDFDTRIPETIADLQLLQQAFLNILFNAIEAMPDGGTISVRTQFHEELNSIQISISDTGKGIDRTIIDKVFQPFFTTKARGIGLGLAITKRLIIENGGDIYVTNNPGRGATFEIFIPVKKTEKR